MNRGTKVALGLWASFGGSHLLMSHEPIRNKLVEICGDEPKFRLLYSAVAISTLVPFAALYIRTPLAQRGAVLWGKDQYCRRFKLLSSTLRAFGGIFVIDAFMSAVKNPLAMNSRLENKEPTTQREINRKYQVYGLQRITRHQEVWGFIFYALGSLLMPLRTPADVLLWGMVPVFGLIAAYHQETRLRKTKPASYFEQTSFFPFHAIYDGRQNGSKVWGEIPPTALACGFCMMGHSYFWAWKRL